MTLLQLHYRTVAPPYHFIIHHCPDSHRDHRGYRKLMYSYLYGIIFDLIKKTDAMKKYYLSFLMIFLAFTVNAQEDKTGLLQDLENDQALNSVSEVQTDVSDDQDVIMTARLKSATRLFGDKYDLTSVIMVLPADTELEILDSDSTYLHVIIEDYEGYIYEKHAIISEASKPVLPEPEIAEEEAVVPEEEPVQQTVQPVQEREVSRFTYLENKYGSNTAAKLMAGKIWKGMEAEMILDSWGNPRKINRVISGNVIKEEWIFRNTWLYIENDILTEWGPIRN